MNHNDRLVDVHSVITGEHYSRDFPRVNFFPPRLAFPTVNTGAGGGAGSVTDYDMVQIRDDVSLLSGNHALKFGANYQYLFRMGVLNGNEHFATLTFFDDPSVIVSNSNGRYPQGFQTPGIVSRWQQANGGAFNGVGSWAHSRRDMSQFSAWFQDDWRATPRLTLNLGLRYDIDMNYLDEEHNGEQRDEAGAGGDRAIRSPRAAGDAVQGHLAARRVRLRLQGGWAAGAARRLRALLRFATSRT